MRKLSIFILAGLASISASEASTISAAATVAKMEASSVAKLALNYEMGSCRLFTGVGTTWKYKLTYFDSGLKTKYFGGLQVLPQTFPAQLQAAPASSVSTEKIRTEAVIAWIKNNLLISNAHAIVPQIPQYSLMAYSLSDRSNYLAQAGNFIKTLMSQNKCGTPVFQKFSADISNMNDVEFYRDDQGVLRCSQSSLNKKIRNPLTCVHDPVRSELDRKICLTIYKIKAAKFKGVRVPKPSTGAGTGSGASSDTGASSGTGVSSGTGTSVSPIEFQPFTAAVKKDFAIDAALRNDFELAPLTFAAETPAAEESLPISALELIDTKIPKTAAEFSALSAQEKATVVSIYGSIKAVEANPSEYVAFSSKVNPLKSNAVKAAILAHVAANPSLDVAYAIPTKLQFDQAFEVALSPIKTITGIKHSLNVHCMEEMMIAPVKAAPMAAQ